MSKTENRRMMACPYNGKACVEGVRSDFPPNEVGQKLKCRMWVGVAGKLPDSEEIVNHEDCAFAWQVTTHIEMSQTNRFVSASSDKFANKVQDAVGAYNALSKSLRSVGDEFRILNENIKRLPEPDQTPDNIIELPPNSENGGGQGSEN